MLQLAGLIIISWILVWVFEKENLSVLGLTPTKTRLKYFAVVFSISSICSSTTFLLGALFAKEEYILAMPTTISSITIEVWNQFRAVLTEELLCRGVLLYILIKRIGQKWAIIISSILFALLHWLNAGIWGNMVPMIIVFVFTFAMGLLLAYSYAKTFSILIPFSIHFGWNLTQNYIFPGTETGNHVFTLMTPPPMVTVSYFVLFIMLLFPKVSVLVFDYLIIRRYKEVDIIKKDGSEFKI
jgi:uncharacterized protein